jgi:hypothetical protein
MTTLVHAANEEEEDVPEGHSVLRVLDPNEGDTRHIWDPKNRDEVAAIKKTFEDLKAKGHIGYRVDDKGDKAEVMQTFDPKAKKLIMAPPQRGG